jgi:hypothetical protein
MMYLSQPPMYPHGRAVLIPRLPMVNPHGGMSQQAMHQYPGAPNPTPQVIAMPSQTMYNPYMMPPNFPMYPGPQAVPGAPSGVRPSMPAEVEAVPSKGGGWRDGSSESHIRSSPVSMSAAAAVSPGKSSASRSGTSSPAFQSAGNTDKGTGRPSVGRKNYRVAASGRMSTAGDRGGGGVGSASLTGEGGGEGAIGESTASGRRGGAAVGVSSISGSRGVEVKAVSAAPIPAAKVEIPLGE